LTTLINERSFVHGEAGELIGYASTGQRWIGAHYERLTCIDVRRKRMVD
jgi:hypothetical protein